jgi:hypothetical protein
MLKRRERPTAKPGTAAIVDPAPPGLKGSCRQIVGQLQREAAVTCSFSPTAVRIEAAERRISVSSEAPHVRDVA